MAHPDTTLESRSRRNLLKVGSLALGGLVIGFSLPFPGRSFAEQVLSEGPEDQPMSNAKALDAFIGIDRDGKVIFTVPKIEMGQGAQSGLAVMIAEELEIGLDQITLKEAPPNEAIYNDKLLNFQATGGSTSIRSNWEPLRQAGAAARLLLIQAAAQRWQVGADQLRAENGRVLGPDGQSFGYGELVDDASKLPVPENIPLKPAEQFKLIGKPTRRLDTPAKVNGTARFTIDLVVPGMKYASARACPVIGGTVRSVDDRAARKVPGVIDVIRLGDAVAVIGEHTWATFAGVRALEIEWDYGDNADIDSAQMEREIKEALDKPGALANEQGDIDKALKDAAKTFEAEYQMPFLAHAALEPMTCVAQVRPDAVELWVGTQVPVRAQTAAAEASGRPAEQIIVNNQLIGGAFGRRLEVDFIHQAAAIAAKVDYPIKLTWLREEDTTHDMYRPHYIDRFAAAMDAEGRLLGWRHTIAGASVLARFAPAAVPDSGLDGDAVEVAIHPIYAMQNLRVNYVPVPPKALRQSWWRGVGPLRSTYMLESFIDEVARSVDRDPVEYRMELLGSHPRAQAVLRLAAEQAGWGEPLEAGHGRGVAVQEVFGSFLATVVELQVTEDKGIKLKRLVVAVDCGQVINPVSVKSQIEGGTLFGLSAALFNEITVSKGRVEQSNFHDYRQLRISEAPPVETFIVESREAPGGVGEAGTAMIAPALVNALASANGTRIRRLPLARAGYYVI
ncbi:xanthine dehydrogenase family protein molybdopterin-binding subunit [Pseudomonas sp. Choline-3u-10]|jgi:isoquinoline 1-oxidoreductase beta subunit|uniref:xanthine dehydrogenase family protein molybdopterin-binding subunit n=1 Tax=Pseudomonadaceae TaxID=135621 RepID=UPI00061829F7|nr:MULTISPECIES: molybdopterin cofactor-binding domain-containing protein [Pseudomonadaceae]MBU0947736.1 molybdopterin-dependent oxidoreductase [Gammaproteobacteria bacterium]HBM07653.1 xanthine dehydrogenase family protein molybdopterin-binding subunit [Pseudomonas sp.]KJJ62987.1 aldehyde dehydrogenase [Pseudomonas sp. 10B238]MBK3797259.1 molybdopterin-dependent oxidoreductase [Stutzerimonas stutzeri]MBK3876099.1 molybdopterin-dependent oxidoreductase [Stutzerimonas stutzeri]